MSVRDLARRVPAAAGRGLRGELVTDPRATGGRGGMRGDAGGWMPVLPCSGRLGEAAGGCESRWIGRPAGGFPTP